MSRHTRPMLSVAREPNGRRSRVLTRSAPQFAPTEVKRLRDAALAGMQNPEWGSELGRLLLAGKLEASFTLRGSTGRSAQRAIDKRLTRRARTRHQPGSSPRARLTRWIRQAPQGKSRPRARSPQSGRCARPTPRYVQPGVLAERVVRRVCEHDEAVCGTGEFVALRRGLLALALFWGMMQRK
jgi:hypothetical protein